MQHPKFPLAKSTSLISGLPIPPPMLPQQRKKLLQLNGRLTDRRTNGISPKRNLSKELPCTGKVHVSFLFLHRNGLCEPHEQGDFYLQGLCLVHLGR